MRMILIRLKKQVIQQLVHVVTALALIATVLIVTTAIVKAVIADHVPVAAVAGNKYGKMESPFFVEGAFLV